MGEVGGDQARWEKASQAGGAHEERIVVSVRMRPMNSKEVGRNDTSDWECINENTIIFKNSLPERSMFPTAYTFDRVFRYDSSTKQVYEEAAKEVALSVVSGINSSIFAYGQTSSGKTYTMTGVTEYALADIYDYIRKHKERSFVVKFSALEIYNEVVRDLLSPESPPLRLLDDPERGTVVEKLTEETLRDWNHVRELLSVCEAQRQIGETSLNETSSRSHQIIRLIIESSAREYLGKDHSSTLTASVDFIDLAGSERASQALSAGARLKEGCHINRSLLTLGTVIRKLSKGRTGHVPYRDSKLTRILQCSLGGNARTAIICTISPARTHVEQSRNTLLFASTAKEVATNAQVNVVMSDKVLVKHLQRELARLEGELKGPVLAPASCDSASILREKDLQIEKLQREIQELIQQRDVAQARLVDMVQVVSEDQSPVHWSEFNQPPKCYPSVWEDDQSTTASSGVADHHSLDAPVIRFNRSWCSTGRSESSVDESYQQIPENAEDQYPPPSDSPRIFIKPSKSVALDLRQLWEERTRGTVVDFEENCKEVRCIETEESIRGRNLESNTLPREDPEQCKVAVPLTVNKSEDAIEHEVVSSPKKDDKELKHVDTNHTYDALEHKLQGVQKTIDLLANQHPDEPSPCRQAEVVASSTRSSKLLRSRSCKATILSSASCPSFQQAEQYETTPDFVDKYSPERSAGFEWNFSAVTDAASHKRLSREPSHTSEQNVSAHELTADNIKSAEEDNTIVRTSIDSVKEMTEIEHEKQLVDEQEKAQSEAHEHPREEEVQEKDQEMERRSSGSVKSVKDVGLDPLEDSFETTSNWPVEFERQQKEIIELWDTCNISLVHRTYFFLLFKGDPSDSIYLEVELRRLSFLKDNFSKGNLDKVTADGSLDLSPASSLKTLRREREMLCKQLQKRYSDVERVELYRKWGIPLDSKQRRLRLAQILWSDTKDMDHIRESAILVAKLVGLLEPGQAPKEMFGLSFAARHVARRSYSWKRHSISSIL